MQLPDFPLVDSLVQTHSRILLLEEGGGGFSRDSRDDRLGILSLLKSISRQNCFKLHKTNREVTVKIFLFAYAPLNYRNHVTCVNPLSPRLLPNISLEGLHASISFFTCWNHFYLCKYPLPPLNPSFLTRWNNYYLRKYPLSPLIPSNISPWGFFLN